MGKRPVSFDEVFQLIKDDRLKENLAFVPDDVLEFVVSNVFQRTFAHLFGLSGNVSVPIKATTGGGLVTAATGPAITKYEMWGLTFPDDNADVLSPDTIGMRVDFWIWEHPVLVRITSDGVVWGSWFELSAGTFHSIDFSVQSVEIKNKTAGQNARYQVNVYY